MKTLEYLQSWSTAQFVVTAFVAGLGVVLMCGLLSVLVVLKRLAFVGQGVSHSAFGGIGVSALVGAATGAAWAAQGGTFEFVVVVLFCTSAALGMAAVGDRRAVQVDTGIGLFLVASMALGGLLVQAAGAVAQRTGHGVGARSWESILFGSILTADWSDAIMAWGLLAVVTATIWWFRRPMLFWAFDETSAPAFGIRVGLMRTVLMVLLALATVTAMKLTGVVLATALLVLPGAIALKLSTSLWRVVALSAAAGAAGLTLGMIASLETDSQPGPCIVLVLTAGFGAALFVGRLKARRSVRPAPAPATSPATQGSP